MKGKLNSEQKRMMKVGHAFLDESKKQNLTQLETLFVARGIYISAKKQVEEQISEIADMEC